MAKTACFYVIELVEGKVKIGQTRCWEGRFKQYTHGGVIDPVQFEIYPCSEIFLRDAERILLDRTARWTIRGEWRFCDFETIASIARDLHQEIESGHCEMPISQPSSSVKKKQRRSPRDAKRYTGSIGNVISAFEVRKRG